LQDTRELPAGSEPFGYLPHYFQAVDRGEFRRRSPLAAPLLGVSAACSSLMCPDRHPCPTTLGLA
jgi:hypothetical protein